MKPYERKERGSLGRALQRAVGTPGEEVARTGRGRSSIFMNKARQELLMYLSRNPCSHMRSISRGLGWSMPTVDWHLRKMMSAGIVQEKKVGRKRVFFIIGQVAQEDQRACAYLSEEVPRRILRALAVSSGLTRGELAARLKVKDVCNHLKALVSLGLVADVRDGRYKRYFIEKAVMERDRCYLRQAKEFKRDIVHILRSDGLDAIILSSRDGILEIEVKVGGGKRTIILHVRPYSAILSG